MQPPPVRYFTTSDGYSIAYAVVGEGRPFLFLPNAFSHIQLFWKDKDEYYTPWWQALASRFRFVHYDGRGQGLSTRDLPLETSATNLLRDVEELIEELDLHDLSLMGEGWAGHLAVRYAVAHPERLRALILAQTSIRNSPSWPSALWELLPSQNWESFLRSLFGLSPVPDVEIARALPRLMQTVSQRDYVMRTRALADSDLTQSLAALQTPTLVLHARGRIDIPVDESVKTASAIANSRLVVIGGPGIFGAPAEGIAAIEAFLAELPLSDEAIANGARPGGLSARQLQVLRLIADGKSNREVAEALVLSERTVERHVADLYAKIGVRNRAEATSFALSTPATRVANLRTSTHP